MIANNNDLRGGQVGDWLVTGWFTPDYRPLAEKFVANLAEHNVPFHLFAKPKLAAGWNTSRKPTVVLEALNAYPSKTLVLMDVDCQIRGDISLVTAVDGDVGICAIARNVVTSRKVRHWLAFETSSRVMVFRPTEGARTFAKRWAAQIERSDVNHDEHSLSWAFVRSPDIRFEYLRQELSGRETSELPNAIIVHSSAHDAQRRDDFTPLQRFLRAIERPFRTGRTKAAKLKGEIASVLLQA